MPRIRRLRRVPVDTLDVSNKEWHNLPLEDAVSQALTLQLADVDTIDFVNTQRVDQLALTLFQQGVPENYTEMLNVLLRMPTGVEYAACADALKQIWIQIESQDPSPPFSLLATHAMQSEFLRSGAHVNMFSSQTPMIISGRQASPITRNDVESALELAYYLQSVSDVSTWETPGMYKLDVHWIRDASFRAVAQRLTINALQACGMLDLQTRSFFYVDCTQETCRHLFVMFVDSVLETSFDEVKFLIKRLERFFNLTTLHFPFSAFQEEDMNYFMHSLSKVSHLKTLGLRNAYCDRASLIESLPNISRLTELKHLDLSNIELHVEGMHALLDAFPRASSALCTLQLDGNALAPDTSNALGKILATKIPCLRTLAFSKSSLGPNAGAFTHGLAHVRGLRQLRLDNANIDASALDLLCTALLNLPHLRVLNLRDNLLGEKGIRKLARAFSRENSSLKKLIALDLSGNQITSKGCKYLQKILSNGMNLSILRLSNNHLQSSGINILSKGGLSNLIRLNELDLSYNGLDVKLKDLFFEAIKRWTLLIAFNLSGNQLGSKMHLLGASLRSLHKLRVLQVNACNLGFEHIQGLLRVLEGKVDVRQLNVDFNRVGNAFEGSPGFSTLRVLRLRKTHIGVEHVKNTSMALQKMSCLAVLDLSLNPLFPINISHADAKMVGKYLSDAFSRLPQLSILYLNDIGINTIGLNFLSPSFAKMKNLRHLELDENEFDVQGFHALCLALQNVSSLRVLSANRFILQQEALKDLKKLLISLPSLVHIAFHSHEQEIAVDFNLVKKLLVDFKDHSYASVFCWQLLHVMQDCVSSVFYLEQLSNKVPSLVPSIFNLAGFRMSFEDASQLPWEKMVLNCVEIDLGNNLLKKLPEVLTGLSPGQQLKKIRFSRNPIHVFEMISFIKRCEDENMKSLLIRGMYSQEHAQRSFKFLLQPDRHPAPIEFDARTFGLNDQTVTLVPWALMSGRVRMLNFISCPLSTLPNGLIHLDIHTLKEVRFSGEYLRGISQSIYARYELDKNKSPRAKAEGLQNLLEVVRLIHDKDQVECTELRLIVVGQSCSGKSTLLKSLAGEKNVNVLLRSLSTDGIELLPPMQVGPYSLLPWDFGGQHVFRFTHQVFLSPHAMYIVTFCVMNPIHEIVRELIFWYDSIVSRASNARILLVGTHCSMVREAFWRDVLQQVKAKMDTLYPVTTYCGVGIDSITRLGLPSLLTQLENCTEAYLCGIRVPRSFKVAKSVLTARVKELQVNHRCLVEREELVLNILENRRDILEALENLGFIVRMEYSDSEGMTQRYIILEPRWLTKVLSAVVTFRHRYIRAGVMENRSLKKLWFGFDANLHASLYALLERMDVLFRLPDSVTARELVGSSASADGSPSSSDDEERRTSRLSNSDIMFLQDSSSSTGSNDDDQEEEEEDTDMNLSLGKRIEKEFEGLYSGRSLIHCLLPKQIVDLRFVWTPSDGPKCHQLRRMYLFGKYIPVGLVGSLFSYAISKSHRAPKFISQTCCVVDIDHDLQLLVHVVIDKGVVREKEEKTLKAVFYFTGLEGNVPASIYISIRKLYGENCPSHCPRARKLMLDIHLTMKNLLSHGRFGVASYGCVIPCIFSGCNASIRLKSISCAISIGNMTIPCSRCRGEMSTLFLAPDLNIQEMMKETQIRRASLRRGTFSDPNQDVFGKEIDLVSSDLQEEALLGKGSFASVYLYTKKPVSFPFALPDSDEQLKASKREQEIPSSSVAEKQNEKESESETDTAISQKGDVSTDASFIVGHDRHPNHPIEKNEKNDLFFTEGVKTNEESELVDLQEEEEDCSSSDEDDSVDVVAAMMMAGKENNSLRSSAICDFGAVDSSSLRSSVVIRDADSNPKQRRRNRLVDSHGIDPILTADETLYVESEKSEADSDMKNDMKKEKLLGSSSERDALEKKKKDKGKEEEIITDAQPKRRSSKKIPDSHLRLPPRFAVKQLHDNVGHREPTPSQIVRNAAKALGVPASALFLEALVKKEEEENKKESVSSLESQKRLNILVDKGAESGYRIYEVAVKVPAIEDDDDSSDSKEIKSFLIHDILDHESCVGSEDDIEKAFHELRTEILLMWNLRHKNIVKLFGYCRKPFAIVMEYMQGGDLAVNLYDPLLLCKNALKMKNDVTTSTLKNVKQQWNIPFEAVGATFWYGIRRSLKWYQNRLHLANQKALSIDDKQEGTAAAASQENQASLASMPLSSSFQILSQHCHQLRSYLKDYYEGQTGEDFARLATQTLAQIEQSQLPLVHELFWGGEMGFQLRVKIAYDIALGLEYLHTLDPPMLHRDLKVENVFLRCPLSQLKPADFALQADPIAKLGDFGISVRLYGVKNLRVVKRSSQCCDKRSSQTAEGRKKKVHDAEKAKLGKNKEGNQDPMRDINALYTAPEVLNMREYSKSADIYSLGIIFNQLISGESPFRHIDTSRMNLKKYIIGGGGPADPSRNLSARELKFLELAKKCSQSVPIKRCSLSRVLARLRELHQLKPPMKKEGVNKGVHFDPTQQSEETGGSASSRMDSITKTKQLKGLQNLEASDPSRGVEEVGGRSLEQKKSTFHLKFRLGGNKKFTLRKKNRMDMALARRMLTDMMDKEEVNRVIPKVILMEPVSTIYHRSLSASQHDGTHLYRSGPLGAQTPDEAKSIMTPVGSASDTKVPAAAAGAAVPTGGASTPSREADESGGLTNQDSPLPSRDKIHEKDPEGNFSVRCITWDGSRYLWVGCQSGVMLVCDANRGFAICACSHPGEEHQGASLQEGERHRGRIEVLLFSQLMVWSGGADGSVRIWNARLDQPLLELEQLTGPSKSYLYYISFCLGMRRREKVMGHCQLRCGRLYVYEPTEELEATIQLACDWNIDDQTLIQLKDEHNIILTKRRRGGLREGILAEKMEINGTLEPIRILFRLLRYTRELVIRSNAENSVYQPSPRMMSLFCYMQTRGLEKQSTAQKSGSFGDDLPGTAASSLSPRGARTSLFVESAVTAMCVVKNSVWVAHANKKLTEWSVIKDLGTDRNQLQMLRSCKIHAFSAPIDSMCVVSANSVWVVAGNCVFSTNSSPLLSENEKRTFEVLPGCLDEKAGRVTVTDIEIARVDLASNVYFFPVTVDTDGYLSVWDLDSGKILTSCLVTERIEKRIVTIPLRCVVALRCGEIWCGGGSGRDGHVSRYTLDMQPDVSSNSNGFSLHLTRRDIPSSPHQRAVTCISSCGDSTLYELFHGSKNVTRVVCGSNDRTLSVWNFQ